MQLEPPNTVRPRRYNVFLTATAERFGQQHITKHRVRNLSAEGACIDRAEIFRAEETLVLGIGNLEEVAAQVRWVRSGLAGLKFTQTIDLGQALGRAVIPPKA